MSGRDHLVRVHVRVCVCVCTHALCVSGVSTLLCVRARQVWVRTCCVNGVCTLLCEPALCVSGACARFVFVRICLCLCACVRARFVGVR